MDDIVVKNVDGLTFLGRGKSKHWVAMDGPELLGGNDSGTRPMELFLISLAGCTGADVASLLKKMRVNYNRFEITVDADRAEEHPKVYTRIFLKYVFWGKNLQAAEDKIKKAINLSQDKYCSVTAMIKSAGIPLKYACDLNELE